MCRICLPAEKAHARNADPTRILVKGVFIPETNHQLATLIRDGTYLHETCITNLGCSCNIFWIMSVYCCILVGIIVGLLRDDFGVVLG